jgi:hypothetical protein
MSVCLYSCLSYRAFISHPFCTAPYCRLPPAVCVALSYFSTLFHKRHNFREDVTEHKMCVLTLSTVLSETFLILTRIQQDIIKTVHTCSHRVPEIAVRIYSIINFLEIFSKNTQMQLSIGLRVFPCGRTDRHTHTRLR